MGPAGTTVQYLVLEVEEPVPRSTGSEAPSGHSTEGSTGQGVPQSACMPAGNKGVPEGWYVGQG